MFVAWIYTRTLPDFIIGSKPHDDRQLEMTKIYSLGDRFEVPDLKAAILQLLTEALLSPMTQRSPYVEATKSAFENLPDSDPLPRVLVEAHCRNYKYTIEEGCRD